MNKIRVLRLLSGAVLAVLGVAVHAEDASVVPFTLSWNLGVVSEYVSRGFRMNWGQPAVQGSVDFVHRSGFYASLWGSQVSERYYANGTVEVDLLTGYRGSFNDQVSYDIGLGAYFYPGADFSRFKPDYNASGRYDTLEATFGVTWRWLNLKYSHALSNYYGYDDENVPLIVWNSGVLGGVRPGKDTRGAGYFEANANFDLGQGVGLALHAAHQHVPNSHQLDYQDYRAGVSKAFSQGWSATVSASTTKGADLYGDFLAADGSGRSRDIGGLIWVIGVNKAF